jgi:hypothetical protein
LRSGLRWNRTRYYHEPVLSHKADARQANLSVPVSYYNLRAADAPLGAGQHLRTVVTEPSLKASVSAFDWGSLEYNAALTALRSALADGPAPTTALVQEHHASASLFPVVGHQLTLSADYSDSRGPAPAVRALFADLRYRYALPTRGRKVDLELHWSNVFDTRQYQYSFVSAFQLAQTTYQLRPAQVLAPVRVSL